MGNHNDPIREGIENFVEPVTQMFRNIGNIGTNISDTISDLGDAVSKSKNESASGADNVEQKGGCLNRGGIRSRKRYCNGAIGISRRIYGCPCSGTAVVSVL